MTRRPSRQTLRVLRAFLDNAGSPLYGRELAAAADLRGGSLYPTLGRLEQAGWITGQWETAEPSETGRPRRRYYSLTALGQREAHLALDDALRELGFEPGLGWT